jgi:hypothetical protein
MVTKDYSFFKYSVNNRGVKPKNVKKIIESMQKYGFISGRPVLCTVDGTIVDGQHRFEAAKELNLEISYEIVSSDFIKTMIDLNSTQTNWALLDYIQSYANQSIDCYRKLLKFEEKYNLGMSNTISICMYNSINKSLDIRKGKIFDINPWADRIAEFVLNCDAVPYYKDHKFIQAICSVYRKLNKEQLTKIKSNLISVPQFGKASDYIVAFENIINKSKRGENRIKLV